MSIKRRLLIMSICTSIIPVVLVYLITFASNAFVFGIEGATSISPPHFLSVNQVTDFDTRDIFSQDDTSLHQLETGEYVLVLPEHTQELLKDLNESSDLIFFSASRVPEVNTAFLEWGENNNATVLIVALTTFGFLGHFLFRKLVLVPIKSSLTDLETAVEEIGKDNLAYRINHSHGNEFDSVYENFNEMASQLLEMTEQKVLDENSRRELIAGISHDLKTPLTSINAYAEGIKKGVATTPEMQEKYMTIIQSKAQEMTYTINQLFLFSKIDLGEFPFEIERVNIGLEMEKTAASFALDYEEKDVLISLSKNVDDISVEIDVVQFKNVIQNIVGNSIKYGAQTDGKIDIRCEQQNNNIAITVKDNGPGVTDEILKNMFDIFYRGDVSRNSAVKGSGLGLAISSKIIKRLNGTIEANHSQSGGLVTTIRLPIKKDDV